MAIFPEVAKKRKNPVFGFCQKSDKVLPLMYIGGTRVESAKLSRAREPGPESTQIVADAPPASIEDDSRRVSRAACDGAELLTG